MWDVVASVAGTLIGGLFGKSNSDDTAAAIRYQAELEYKAAMEQLAFGKQMWQDWQQDYGVIQDQVGQYYANLTDTVLKQQYEMANTSSSNTLYKAYEQASKNLATQMNRSGMGNSGAAVAANLQLQSQALSNKAQNAWQTEQLKANAQNVIMGQKANWVAQGQAQQNAAAGIINGAYAQQAASAQSAKQMYMQQLAQQQASNTNFIVQGIGQTIGAFVNSLGNSSSSPTTSGYNGMASYGASNGAYNTLPNIGLPNSNTYATDSYFNNSWLGVGGI